MCAKLTRRARWPATGADIAAAARRLARHPQMKLAASHGFTVYEP